VRVHRGVACAWLFVAAPLIAPAQTAGPGTSSPATSSSASSSSANSSPETPGADVSAIPPESTIPVPEQKYQWLDEVRELVYETVWESAMHVDRWFGSEQPDWAYEQASGSLAPAVLWSRFYGWQHLLRFIGDVPLPQLSDSVHAFIGRLNPEEFISESQASSGAIPNPYAPYPTDQTLLGIQYTEPVHPGVQWDSGAGLPVTLSRFDPYFKGGYLYELGSPQEGVLIVRQDAFYQSSQGGFGVTTRVDLQRLIGRGLLLSWTASTTYAQRSYGWNSYSTVDAYFAYAESRALVVELTIDGVGACTDCNRSFDSPVPLQDYGGKVAYRRSILRDWLILEIRASLDWPRDFFWQHREMSPGVGVAFEMEFGSQTFLARPITF